MGPLIGVPGTLASAMSLGHSPCCFPRLEVVGLLVPALEPWGGGTSVAELSFPILTCHTRAWDQPFLRLCLSCQSQGGLVSVSLVRTSGPVDFRWFPLMVSLEFRCNFAVVGGGEHCISPFCHWRPILLVVFLAFPQRLLLNIYVNLFSLGNF